ncbi:MAG: homoprotocatechuate degradation operon regulator HpaR [Ilumatobacter sp.]|uniref:homoprotocatechuate degradation operon regulator HpaR n=1 Tax=Ilumatobacter sp. TaxID=1967498 RepID=UPI00391C40BB
MSDPTQRADGDDATAVLRSFERSLPMALMRARESIMSRFRPLLAEHDLSEQQWRVLRALTASGPSSIGELAERTHLLGPSLSRMAATLDRRGLVERRPDHDDARRTEVSITDAGRAVVADVAPHSERVYNEIEAGLGAGRLDELHQLLEQLAEW